MKSVKDRLGLESIIVIVRNTSLYAEISNYVLDTIIKVRGHNPFQEDIIAISIARTIKEDTI